MSAATVQRTQQSGGRRIDAGRVPRLSPFLVWGFGRFLTGGFGLREGFVARHFHSIALANDSVRIFPPNRPLVFFLNHSSWWDPIVAFLLARHVVPGRHPYAPIDQKALDCYPLLNRTGLFGVDRSARGSLAFLATSQAVLSRSDASLWLTPEGRFVDPRDRPIVFEPGLGHLASRVEALFVPVAIDYTFWTERLPEVLTQIGQPLDTSEDRCDAIEWSHRFEKSLATTLDQLLAKSQSRDPSQFQRFVRGGAGVGMIYDVGRRMTAIVNGSHFSREHVSGGSEDRA